MQEIPSEMLSFHIDRTLPDCARLRNANRYLVEGWIFSNSNLKELSIQVGDQRFSGSDLHQLRADVCRAHLAADPELRSLFSGFSIPVILQPVTTRVEHAVTLHARFADGRTVREPIGTLTLEPASQTAEPVTLPAGISSENLIVICMATYKPSEELFRRQVQSMIDQEYRNWICLVADDASPPEFR